MTESDEEETKAAGAEEVPGPDPHLEEARGRWRIYLTVFILLFVLTITELFVGDLLPGSKEGQIAMLVVLMMAKALLVVLYYMHLRWESRVLRWVAAIPFSAAIFYVLIVILV